MSLLDYHGKNLLPAVWSTDGDLGMRFRAQLDDQLKRFPELKDVLLVGDSVSHYWRRDSDVDVIVIVPEDDLPEVEEQARRASGYPLTGTTHNVRFWPFSGVTPEVLTKHFGAVYSPISRNWYGVHVHNETALRSADAVINRVNWNMYKTMYDDDLFPYDWRIAAEAFGQLSDAGRVEVLDSLRYRVSRIDRNVTKLLKRQPRDVWRLAQKVDEELVENEELPPDASSLPPQIVFAMMHRFRYQDLLDTFTAIDEKIYNRKRYARTKRQAYEAPKTTSRNVLFRRFLQLSEMILQREGGSSVAMDGVYDLISFILDQNRYVLTDMRRRRIVYRLYRRYYMGQKEESN